MPYGAKARDDNPSSGWETSVFLPIPLGKPQRYFRFSRFAGWKQWNCYAASSEANSCQSINLRVKC
jgi:hypothetical protein